MPRIHTGAIGLPIFLTIWKTVNNALSVYDPADAVATTIYLRYQDGSTVQLNGAVRALNSKNEYSLRYDTKAEDFTRAGSYEVQAFVQDADGKVWPSTIERIVVDKSLI